MIEFEMGKLITSLTHMLSHFQNYREMNMKTSIDPYGHAPKNIPTYHSI